MTTYRLPSFPFFFCPILYKVADSDGDGLDFLSFDLNRSFIEIPRQIFALIRLGRQSF